MTGSDRRATVDALEAELGANRALARWPPHGFRASIGARWYGLDTVADDLLETGRELRHRLSGRGAQRFRRAPAVNQEGATVRLFEVKNPFGSVFGSSRRENFLARHVLREHARGRQLVEIFDDPYVRNWSTTADRRRLLDTPEVVAALGENAVDELRRTLRRAA